MKKIAFAFFTASVLFTSSAFSQESNPLDEKYTPKPFDAAKKKSGVIGSTNTMKNAFTAEITSLFRGQVVLEYQRELLSSGLIGFASVGFPVMQDVIHSSMMQEEITTIGISSDSRLSYNQLIANGSFQNAAPMIQGGLRYLLDYNEDLDGIGIELRVRMQREDFTIVPGSTADFLYFNPNPINIEARHMCIMLGFRSQTSAAPRSKFAHGIAYGIGLRRVEYDVVNVTPSTTWDGMFQQNLIASQERETGNVFMIYMSYSLGIGW